MFERVGNELRSLLKIVLQEAGVRIQETVSALRRKHELTRGTSWMETGSKDQMGMGLPSQAPFRISARSFGTYAVEQANVRLAAAGGGFPRVADLVQARRRDYQFLMTRIPERGSYWKFFSLRVQ